jgi:uncharacterized membrane protein
MVKIMNKSKLLASAFAVAALSFSSAQADVPEGMEKCKAVDSEGKSIVREHQADCASKTGSCAGHNNAGDPEAWVMVPKGECDKINKGDMSGISDEIKAKLITEDAAE